MLETFLPFKNYEIQPKFQQYFIKNLSCNYSVIILNYLWQIDAGCNTCNGSGFIDEEITYYEIDENGKTISKKEIQSVPCPDCLIT